MAAVTVDKSTSLIDVFNDLLVLGAQLRDVPNPGSVESVRARLQQLFQATEERGRSVGLSPDTLTQARYAVAAFLDEMLINSRWPHKDEWAARPLQYELFGEFTAGEGFFKRLESIRGGIPVNADLLELYTYCLMLGFEGQYKLQDRDKLRGLIEDLTRQIQGKRGEIPPLSPKGRRPEELLELVKRELPVWVIVATSASLVLLFYLGLSFLVGQDAAYVDQELRRLLQEVRG
jgi:type VI secretion system protein ImpK